MSCIDVACTYASCIRQCIRILMHLSMHPHMGARQNRINQGVCNRARAHSRCILHYIGYVSQGAFCDNPPLSKVGTKALQQEAQGPRARASQPHKFGVVEPARDIPSYMPPPMFCIGVAFANQRDCRVVSALL